MPELTPQTLTGQDFGDLAAMLGGAVFGGTVAEMTVGRFFPTAGPEVATMIAGGAAAYFGKGMVRKAGQGALIVAAADLLREGAIFGLKAGGRAASQMAFPN